MGHERIGRLPRTVAWRQIVEALKTAGSGTEADVSQVAAKTIQQVRHRFQSIHKDSGVQAAFGFLVAIARAEEPTAIGRAAPDIPLPSEAPPLRLAVALNNWVDKHAQSLEYAELAKRAAGEVLAGWHREKTRQLGLFAHAPSDSSRDAWLAASSGAGFSEVSRLFFAHFTERYLRYFLDREASSVTASIEQRELLTERLHRSVDLISRHAFETARIAQSFAAGWYNKHARTQTPTNARLSTFLRIAFGKLREELRRESET
jgi:hypothetical protein